MAKHKSLELPQRIADYTSQASEGINQELGRPLAYDQTRGNRCDLLTLSVMNQTLSNEGLQLSRELHQNEHGDWHYILAHRAPDAEPTETDLMSDLNPWQWGGSGQGILHMPRNELMDHLSNKGAPAHFVALRSLTTITKAHDLRSNPHRQ